MKEQTINNTFGSINEAFEFGEKDNFFRRNNQYICISEYNEKLWNELIENGFILMEHSEVVFIGNSEKSGNIKPKIVETQEKHNYLPRFGSWYGYLEPEFPDREGQND